MPRDRSSANPAKLLAYAAAGEEMDGVLQAKAAAVLQACTHLRLAQALDPFDDAYSVGLRDVDTELATVAADWQHLDDFANDVALGFVAANQLTGSPRPRPTDTVLSFTDGYLARVGHIGFADRQEAIDAADEMAAELDRLWEQSHASVQEIEAFVDMATSGQHDPAFAVALSEQIGVEGYVQATTLIHFAHGGGNLEEPMFLPTMDDDQAADAATAVQVLGTTLTTALATRTHDGDPPPGGDRLSEEFVDDLVAGYDPSRHMGPDTDLRAQTLATLGVTDLSVLLRFTDPPTEIAVQIAQHRLTPWLAADRTSDVVGDLGSVAWRDYASPVGNYATMLGRNPDASTLWLDSEIDPSTLWPGSEVMEGTRNVEWAVRHDDAHDYSPDTGTGLAQVIENGLTHPGVAPHEVERRQRLMELAIDTIAAQDEVRSDPFHGALARGVDANIAWIAEQTDDVGPRGRQLLGNTRDLVRELMADDRATAEVYAATIDQVANDLAGMSPDNGGEVNHRVGNLMGLVTAADSEAEVGSAQERAARRATLLNGVSTAANKLIGLAPGGAHALDAANIVGLGPNQLLANFQLTHEVDAAYADADAFYAKTLDHMTALYAVHEYATGTWTADQVRAATGGIDIFAEGFADEARPPITPLSAMTDEEETAFWRWVNSGPVVSQVWPNRADAGQAFDEAMGALGHGGTVGHGST